MQTVTKEERELFYKMNERYGTDREIIQYFKELDIKFNQYLSYIKI